MDGSDSWNDIASAAPSGVDAPRRLTEYTDEKTSAATLARVENLRVLVVDQNAARLDALCRRLRKLGLDAHAGDVGREGYRQAIAVRPDVVLSDLTTPGEPGWWLFQRFRRQPLLRWTPVLLLRWWEEVGDGRERILTGKVVERLVEALAPVRVLEERVTVGRFVGDRVEATGVPVLLEVIKASGFKGCFSVNDSWNIFECRFEGGRPVSAVRRGVDGGTDGGETAFLQLVLCESGRWSLRTGDTGEVEPNLEGRLEDCLERSAATIAGLFGPDSRMDAESGQLLEVRLPVVREVAASLAGGGRQLIETLAAGASPAEIESLVTKESDIVVAERVLLALLRNGAVVLRGTAADGSREPEPRRVARATASLLGIVGADHREPGPLAGRSDGQAPVSRPETGYYRVSRVQAEKVAARAREGLIVPGARTSISDDIAPAVPEGGNGEAPERLTPVVSPSPAAREIFFGSPTESRRAGAAFVLPRESLAPPPDREEEPPGPSQMWLAILLALVLGGLVLAGILLVAGAPGPAGP
jgi:CheY-like chemotaxis protein